VDRPERDHLLPGLEHGARVEYLQPQQHGPGGTAGAGDRPDLPGATSRTPTVDERPR
jgi:hypothetical protein